jgi:pseudouridine-5'-phosphate glycosidase
VAEALGAGGPVVALESTLLAHGLPRPDNRAAADDVEAAVRAGGAIPATIAVLDGVPHVGLTAAEVDRVCADPDLAKLGVRDLPVAAALGRSGATTVSSTALLAAAAGIGVFATGGLGGVHRDAATTFDESADLVTLARTPITVVSAGVKSILDVGATLERLETLGIAVLGFGTDRFPGFYLRDAGYAVDHRVDTAEEVADVMAARRSLGTDRAALLVANPLPEADEVPRALHDQVLAAGLAAADAAGVRGKDVTPFLLEHFHRTSGGESLRANITIILRNAALAAQIAVASSTR